MILDWEIRTSAIQIGEESTGCTAGFGAENSGTESENIPTPKRKAELAGCALAGFFDAVADLVAEHASSLALYSYAPAIGRQLLQVTTCAAH